MSEEVSEEKVVGKGHSKIVLLLIFLLVLVSAVFTLASTIFLIPLFFFSFLLFLSALSSKDELSKMLRRNVTTTLGMAYIILAIFIILTGGLIGAFAIIKDKDNTISSLIKDKDNTISSLNSNYKSQLRNLENEVGNLSNIVSLNDSTVWIDNETISNFPSYPFYLVDFDADYSGYVSVTVYSSTSNQTTLEAGWGLNYGMSYNNKENIGSHGTLVFPVVATDTSWTQLSIIIDFGTTANNSAVVTAIYYY